MHKRFQNKFSNFNERIILNEHETKTSIDMWSHGMFLGDQHVQNFKKYAGSPET